MGISHAADLGVQLMRRRSLFDSLFSLESLEIRLSPSSLALGVPNGEAANVASLAIRAKNDLGDDPPITQDPLPPTGPLGPGSSS